jgi:hypothetical protein
MDWCGDAETMEAVLWKAHELNGYGMAALKKLASERGIPVEDMEIPTQSFRPASVMAVQQLNIDEVSACRQACAGNSDMKAIPTQYADRLLGDRNNLMWRIKATYGWQAMSTEQLQAECARRQLPIIDNQAMWDIRGQGGMRAHMVGALQQDTIPGAKGPIAQGGWSPSYNFKVWSGPAWSPEERHEEPARRVHEEKKEEKQAVQPHASAAAVEAVQQMQRAQLGNHQRLGLVIAPPKPRTEEPAPPNPFPRELAPAAEAPSRNLAAVAAMDGEKTETLYREALVSVACLLELSG